MKTYEMEIALSRYFDPRRKLILSNVFWGLNFHYELDLMIVSKSGYATEVEIKVSISDLKAEKKKSKSAHCSNRIKYLYFAVPKSICEKAIPLIPEKAGILVVDNSLRVRELRTPKLNKSVRKLNEIEFEKLAKLATMRVWNLKERLYYINKYGD